MPMHRRKTLPLVIILMILLTFLSTVGVIYAYVYQSIVRDYGTTISATNVSFKFNGKIYIDEIGTTDLVFTKGEPCQVDLEVMVTGSQNLLTNYSISFELQNSNGSTTNVSEFTQAIEVYKYDGNRYVFLCMLSDIGDVTVDGSLVTNHAGTIPLQFVYSLEAGSYFDNMANNANFIIHANASAELIMSSSNYVFANADSFNSAFTAAANVGKTIILLSNVTVDTELTSSGKVGIDLNGNTLTLNEDLNVTYTTPSNLIGVINSGEITAGVKAGGIAGDGTINVSGCDCYLIDNYITSGKVVVSLTNESGIFDDFVGVVKERLSALNDGTERINGDDVSFVFDDLQYYCSPTVFDFTADSDSVIQYDSVNGRYEITAANNDLTASYIYYLRFSSSSDADLASGTLVVRGTSVEALRTSLLAELPDLVTSSIYLKGYDAASDSYIDWEIVDGMDGILLDSNGRYRKNGINAIMSAVDDFSDRTADLYLYITRGATQSVYYESIDVEVLSAEERTVLVYDNLPVTLKKGVLMTYDIYTNALISTYLTKADLTAITITEISDEDGYISIVDNTTNTAFDTVVLYSFIPQNDSSTAEIRITFTYGSGASAKTYSIDKTLVLSGEVADVTKYDMQYRLQSAFSTNDYIDGLSSSFYAYGALLPRVEGVAVDLTIEYFFEFANDAAAVTAGFETGTCYNAVNNLNEAKNYIVITYEYVEIEIENMIGQVAYYILDSGNYVLATDLTDDTLTYYERKANVEILPSRITTAEDKSVTVYALLYNEIIDGVKVYVDPISSEVSTLYYELSLDIEGIYHNNANQIVDYNLYLVLREHYDANDDGLISGTEAQAEWSSVRGRITDSTYSDYDYIDFSGAEISSLKGIEYFINAEGFKFDDCDITDISSFSTLENLKYLNLANNTITDISALSYMDKLEYLNLNNNSVTSIEALRYLPSVERLLLRNNSITDFDPLTVTTSLLTLDVTGMTKGGTLFTNHGPTMYYFALIKINNPDVSFVYSPAISIAPAELIAAKVMRDLEEINRVSKVLYLPTTYDYYDGTSVQQYTLDWFVENNETSIVLNKTDGRYNGTYSIVNPLFDKAVTLRLQVFELDFSNYYSIRRTFNLTLETTNESDFAYIYDAVTDTYVSANDAIPDLVLRNLVFSVFNSDASSNIVTELGVPESRVISEADFLSFSSNTIDFLWNDLGIQNLTGIKYFAPLLKKSLDLSGNTLTATDPLSPLVYLTNLTSLTLGGQEYDFTELVGLTGLRTLFVYECYNLDSDDTLNALYRIYLNNSNVSIYLRDQNTVWKPYAEIMARHVRNLPSVMTFINQGDSAYVYGDSTTHYFEIPIYEEVNDDPFQFTITAVSFYERYKATATSGTYFRYNSLARTIIYHNAYGYEESAFAKITISSTTVDGHGVLITGTYYVQLNARDAGSVIYVYIPDSTVDWSEGYTIKTVAELFTARSTKEDVLPKLYQWFATATNGLNPNPAPNSADDIYDELTGTANSSGKYVYYYLDTNTGIYHVTTDVFSSSGAMSGKTSLTINGVYSSGESTLDGLRYLTTITELTIARDANLGDGSELVNLTKLSINYSALDFTMITTYLPKLTNLTITNEYLFIAKTADDDGTNSAFKYFTNLATFSVTKPSNYYSASYINDFSFLLGLLKTNNNGDVITTLKTLTLTSITRSNNAISTTSAGYLKQLYQAAVNNGIAPVYQVGSTSSNSATGYFRVITDENNVALSYHCTDNTDGTKQTSWDTASSSSLSVSDLAAYNNVIANMSDMGLKVGSDYWTENRTFNLATSATLTLPASSGEIYYGLAYSGDSSVTHCDYPITWETWFVNTFQSVSTATYSTDTTLDVSSLGNGYLVLVGTITGEVGGVAITDATSKSYMYHFVVGTGDGVYSAVSDITLRAWLFAYVDTITSSISLNGLVSNSMILSGLGAYSALTKDTVSNFIYDLTGIGGVFSAQQRSAITSIELHNEKFTDISPLYSFTNLQTLDLSCSAIGNVTQQGYAKLSSGISALTNLVTLDLSNNISITPQDVATLALTAMSNLANLYLAGTRCVGSYDVLGSIQTIIDNTTSNSISLALNNSTANAVTLTEITSFLDTTAPGSTSTLVNTLISGGINEFSILYQRADTLTIGGIDYVLNLTSGTRTLISGSAVYSTVPIKIIVSATGLDAQFDSVYVSSTFSAPGSNTMLFGTSGLNINFFDTELIAYLVSNVYLSQNNSNYWILNTDVTISENIGISKYDNIDLLRGSRNLTVNTGSNPLAYSDEGAIVTGYTYSASAGTSEREDGSVVYLDRIYFADGSIVYLDKIEDYTFSAATANTYTAVLPTHVWVKGERYQITWGVSGNISGASVNSANFYSITNSGGNNTSVSFSLNSGNVTFSTAGTASGNFAVTATVNSDSRSNSVVLTRTATDVAAQQYNFFIEVTLIGEGDSYTDVDGTTVHNTVGDVVLRDNDGHVYQNYGGLATTRLYLFNNKYYTNVGEEVPDGATLVNCVNAGAIFPSGRLTLYLIIIRNNNVAVYDYSTIGANAVQSGYLITKSIMMGMTTLTISTLSSPTANLTHVAATTTQGVTSIQGLEIFHNLNEFTTYAGAFSNIECLSTVSLEKFYYGNSEYNTDERNYMIYDFTPLITGSKDTLKEFRYNTLATVQITDLSFLLAFTELESVRIGSYNYASNGNYNGGEGLAYLKSASFQYVLARLIEKGVSVYVNATWAGAEAYGFTYDTSNSVTENGIVSYALTISSDYRNASETLNTFSTSNRDDVTLHDNYLLTVDNYTAVNNVVTIALPAVINQQGTLNLIDWDAASANVTVVGYYLTASATIDGTTYAANVTLSPADAAAIAASVDYYTLTKNGTTQLNVKIEVDVTDINNISQCKNTLLICSITKDGFDYERMFTLEF